MWRGRRREGGRWRQQTCSHWIPDMKSTLEWKIRLHTYSMCDTHFTKWDRCFQKKQLPPVDFTITPLQFKWHLEETLQVGHVHSLKPLWSVSNLKFHFQSSAAAVLLPIIIVLDVVLNTEWFSRNSISCWWGCLQQVCFLSSITFLILLCWRWNCTLWNLNSGRIPL